MSTTQLPSPVVGADSPCCRFCHDTIGGVEGCVMIVTGNYFWIHETQSGVLVPSSDTGLEAVLLPNEQLALRPTNVHQGLAFFHQKCFDIVMGDDPFEREYNDENDEPEEL